MKTRGWIHNLKFVPYIFILPVLLYYLCFWIYPFLMNLYMSFMDWHFMKPSKWIGLANYKHLFADSIFLQGLKHSAIYCLFLPLNLIPAFLVAVLINRIKWAQSFFKTVYFATHIIPLFGLALILRFLFADQVGLVNGALTAWGLERMPWLSNDALTMAVIILLVAYKGVGWNMLVYLAGLQSINKQIYESAQLDGASAWKTLTRITIPLMKPSIIFTFIMGFIYVFQLFAPIMLIANRGQFTKVADVKTPSVDAYIFTFGLDKAGYGASMMLVTMLFVLVFSLIVLRVFDKQKV